MVGVVVTAVAICLCRHANARPRHNGVGGTSSRSGTTEVTAFSNGDIAPVLVNNRVYDDTVEPTVSRNFCPCASNKIPRTKMKKNENKV